MLRSGKIFSRVASLAQRAAPAVTIPKMNMSSEYKFSHPPVPEDGIHRPPRASPSSYNKPLPELYHEWMWDATHPEPFFDRHDERLPPPRVCLASTASYLIAFFTIFGVVPALLDSEETFKFYPREAAPTVNASLPNVTERTTVVLL